MSDKRNSILKVALELFSHDGYNATATSKIAKAAGVSEGLIFRHFANKKGLLQAITEDAELRLKQLLGPILFETDPKIVIRSFIELPFSIDKSHYDFWKLQFKLKWDTEYHNPDKLKPLLEKLSWAFAELGIAHPEQEAYMLNDVIESVSIRMIRSEIYDTESYKDFLLNKYQC